MLKIFHIRKYYILLKNGMKPNLNVLKRKYFNATYVFMFEINPFKVIVIWFIKGSKIFKIPIKYDLFS
jgi:hypothetical protein